MKNVVIIGASNKAERYAYIAFNMLRQYGHKVFAINPTLDEIDGEKVYKNLADVTEPIDTVTLYLNPAKVLEMFDDIVKLNPKRVIMNPGTESDELEAKLKACNIQVLRACTLVMLRSNQF